MSNFAKKTGVICIAGLLTTGCVVYEQPRPATVVVAQPVVTGPGVEVIEVEPAPAERVYIYEPGYPPGVYFCDDYYWYNGYRYPHDVFVNQYVVVNVRENRYIDVEENRRVGQQIEVQHRQQYAAKQYDHRRPEARPAVHQDPGDRVRQ